MLRGLWPTWVTLRVATRQFWGRAHPARARDLGVDNEHRGSLRVRHDPAVFRSTIIHVGRKADGGKGHRLCPGW